MLSEDNAIARNVAVHDQIASHYEKLHDEIYNDIEQTRLRQRLREAIELVTTGSLHALDYGCGSGNLTRHLIDLGARVTSADVSQKFLRAVKSQFDVETLLLDGRGIEDVGAERFDFVGVYSVLHHIPDYLAALREIARVCKRGGVIYLDHEPTEEYWTMGRVYSNFRRQALRPDWRKYFRPSNYAGKMIRLFINPKYANEGDIHVWPDDHIEWSKIKEVMSHLGFQVVIDQSYLLYRGNYRREVFEKYKAEGLTDTRVMAFRKQH